MNRQPITAPKITALYSRLSKDDERAGESLSIEHQKAILEDYANKQGFTNLCHYVDDGWSGTDFSRPDWKRMIADIEADKVGICVTKDLSRLGRDHLQVGFHTEVVFRKHGVRFIAIGNNIDSDIQESTEFAPFLNIFSEWYARDTSRKIKTVLHAKGNSGKHMTNSALYGYVKSPDDKNVWLLDDEAACVVRRIFQMTIDGKGPFQIARILTDERIHLRPTAYIALRDGNEVLYPEDKYYWHGASISCILDKPEYMGDTINFRTYKESYKDKNHIHRPQEEWVVFENTQPPIVDRETWHSAQKCRTVKRRPNKKGDTSILTGLVYCAQCGSRLYHHIRKDMKHDSDDYYACPQYGRYPKRCTHHFIRTSALESIALDAIRAISGFVKGSEDEFVRHVREMHDLQSVESAKTQQKQLSKHQKRHTELDSLIKQLYEDKVNGSLSAKRFEILAAEYETEQDGLERQINELKATLEVYNEGTGNAEKFIAMVRRYTEIPELTGTILNEYIDKILVYEASKPRGRREQTVEIIFNMIGGFTIPGQAEPEPFDPVEHRKALQRAAYYRNKEKLLKEPDEVQEAIRIRRNGYNKKHRDKKRAERETEKALEADKIA